MTWLELAQDNIRLHAVGDEPLGSITTLISLYGTRLGDYEIVKAAQNRILLRIFLMTVVNLQFLAVVSSGNIRGNLPLWSVKECRAPLRCKSRDVLQVSWGFGFLDQFWPPHTGRVRLAELLLVTWACLCLSDVISFHVFVIFILFALRFVYFSSQITFSFFPCLITFFILFSPLCFSFIYFYLIHLFSCLSFLYLLSLLLYPVSLYSLFISFYSFYIFSFGSPVFHCPILFFFVTCISLSSFQHFLEGTKKTTKHDVRTRSPSTFQTCISYSQLQILAASY